MDAKPEVTATPSEEPLAKPLGKADRDKLARMSVAFDKIDRLLARLGLQGLQRVSEGSATELLALQQTAHNAALVNIERQIDVLATMTQRYLDRDPLFKMNAYMATINRIWLLNHQARRLHAKGLAPKEMVGVIGEMRRSYVERDEVLMLQPLGASGWVTDTDFVGITIYFYADVPGAPIYQASNTKPCAYFGRDPRRLLHDSISDYVNFSIHDMAHGAFAFTKAKISRDGRLSLHKALEVQKAPYIGARAYQALACEDWQSLVQRVKVQEMDPVRGGGACFALVSPASYGKVVLDEKNARATMEVNDKFGASLEIEVGLRIENNFLVDNLEYVFGSASGAASKASPESVQTGKRRRRKVVATPRDTKGRGVPALVPNALFGRAWIAEGKLKFFPLTGVYNQAVVLNERGKQRVNEIHLALEDLKYVSAKM